MCSISVQVDKIYCKYWIQTSENGLIKVINLNQPIGENSKIKIYINNCDYTEHFTNLDEFNNQHSAFGNLLGSREFICLMNTEIIILKIDVDSKFSTSTNRDDLDKWKNNLEKLVREVECDFSKSYIRKYLVRSMYGYARLERANYENISDVIIKNYNKLLKCYKYIMTNKIFKNSESKLYYNEYVEANSIRSDLYNDIFGEKNIDGRWHEKIYIKYDTDEIVYLRYMFYRFTVIIDKCIKSVTTLNNQYSNTISSRTCRETLDTLNNIRKKFSLIGVNCPVCLPNRAMYNKRYKFIYNIYKNIISKVELITDFSKRLEKEGIDSINYLSKLYEIALFKKIVNIVSSKTKLVSECISNNGLLYRFVSDLYEVCIYLPFGNDLSAVGLESVAVCDKESRLDIIVNLEVNNKLISCIVFDAKYKYYGLYDEDIGQMVRYANAVTRNGKLVVSNCYLVFPFNKSMLNNLNTVDKKYHILTDDLYKDKTLEFILVNELSVIDHALEQGTEAVIIPEINSKEILRTYTVNNITYTIPRKTIEYNDDQTIKSFNIPSNANSRLADSGIYRVDNKNDYWFKWGKWENRNYYRITNVLIDESYEVKLSMDLELPARLLEYAYRKDREKTVEFMNSVEWCVCDRTDKVLSIIKETGYNYNISHTVNILFNRVNKILRELDIVLEVLIPKEEFYSIFKTLDLDKCYQNNIDHKEFMSISEARHLMLIGTRIVNIYIKKFNFKVSTYAEALYILLCYLVFIEYVNIDKILDANIISTDILKYNYPNVIPSTNLFFEQTENVNDLIAVMETLSKIYDVDIKLKININEHY
ncbi:hypothetical protein CLSAP_07010 [Clostridium saccharoperbutylacetonicum]|nr:hypothetical protein CLSAP_07010 [Clostridium saccharoperbutylacetonicum]